MVDRKYVFNLFIPEKERSQTALVAGANSISFVNVAKPIYDYLNGRSQKIKAGSSFSSELDISYGVAQGSILGPLLFNFDICDLFFVNITSDIANYADDTTPYEYDQHCDNLINNMELTVEKIGLSLII